jgi:MFS family permease
MELAERSSSQTTAQASGRERMEHDEPSAYPLSSDSALVSDRTESVISSEPAANAVESLPPVTRRDQLIALAVASAAIFQSIGANVSYGVFQSFYTSSPDTPLSPSEAASRGNVALIGTLGAGITWGGSIIVHPLVKRVGHKYVALAGGILMSLGFLLASFGHTFWQLLLTQGFLYGVGSAMLYFPLISVAPPYFNTRRGAATGIIMSAGGVGGLVFSLSIRALLDAVGVRWTLRAMAFENLLVSVPSALYARKSRTIGALEGSLVSLKIAKKPAFFLQATAALLQAAGNFVPMTFTPEFSTILGYSVGFGAALLAINNGVNAVSRILMGVMADRFGRQNLLVLSVIGSAASVWGLWLGAVLSVGETAKGMWVTFVIFYGALAGGFNSLYPAITPDIFPLSTYAPINSFLTFVRGIGAAFGSPVGGQILGDSRSGSTAADVAQALQDYRNLIWYDGTLLTACAFCVVGVRVADAIDRKAWRWKA